MRRVALALIAFALLDVAHADAPPPDSPDGKLTAPYRDWYRQQQVPATGGSCCSESDGRPVDADIRDGHWVAHVTAEHWPGVRDQWLPIPDEIVIRAVNPTGSAVLWLLVPHKHAQPDKGCMYCGSIDQGVDQSKPVQPLCFSPPDGV